MSGKRSRWARWTAVALFVAALAATLFFGLRSYRSWLVLHSAYALDAPDLGNIRAWMTLGYVSRLYGTPEAALLDRLQLAPTTSPETPLKDLALRQNVAPFDYIQQVQRAIAAVERNPEANGRATESGWLSTFNDRLLAALLVYGYPALAVILVFGSIGFPLPDGLLAAAAGSLIAQGRMDWTSAGLVSVEAKVGGTWWAIPWDSCSARVF